MATLSVFVPVLGPPQYKKLKRLEPAEPVMSIPAVPDDEFSSIKDAVT